MESKHDPKAKRPRDLVCKGCGHGNRDGKMVQFSDGNIKCWACGYLDIDPKNRDNIKSKKEWEYTPQTYKNIPASVVAPYMEMWLTNFSNRTLLHHWLVGIDLKMRHDEDSMDKFDSSVSVLAKYNVGIDPVSRRTAFIFQDIDQNYRYIKSVQYLPSGKRDKNLFPYSKYKTADGFKTCLFGEHLLKGHKGIVNLVESEKTALVCAMAYPDQLWLATAGSNGLTPQKAEHLRGRTVYKYVDCDKAGRQVDRDKKVLAYFNAGLVVKDVDPARTDGADIADIIIENL